MDFHHRNPAEKLFEIGPGSFRHSREDILIEVAKCDLLCSNCHRIVEYEKRLLPTSGNGKPCLAHNQEITGSTPVLATILGD